jgi:hypothetical protein
MKHNVGSFDAGARTVAGFLIILVGHHYREWWALLGVVPIVSGALGFCPAYCLFHFNTTSQDEDHSAGGTQSRV